MNYRLFKRNLKEYFVFIFVPKFRYWVPTFYAWAIFTLFMLIYCFAANLQNSHLSKKEGIIKEVYYTTFSNKGVTDILYNFKLENDPQRYGQYWYFDSFFPVTLFLFGKTYIPHELAHFKRGDNIEFYIDNRGVPFDVLLYPSVDPNTGKPDISVKTITTDSIATSYGLRVNNNTWMSYTKRNFVTKSFGIFALIQWLFFVALFPFWGVYFMGSTSNIGKFRRDLKEKYKDELYNPKSKNYKL